MMKRKSIGIINTFLALMIVALLCVPSALVYAYTTTGIKLNTDYTLTFVPYSGFEATSISHFNEALYQWNSAAGITLMSREPTLRHSSTTFPEDDNKTRIYKAYIDKNIAVKYQLQANYKTGFWEIIILHTKPLENVPDDMMRCNYS